MTMPDHELQILHNQLDVLWAKYFAHLEAYCQAQQSMQQHLSEGFISLAQANRYAAHGVRIGQDWYDERCKATARARVKVAETNQSYDCINTSIDIIHISQKRKVASSSSRAKNPASASASSHDSTSDGKIARHDEKSEDEEYETQKDPITWYGLLPSSSLRSAQTSFVKVVKDLDESSDLSAVNRSKSDRSPISQACNAARAMRSIEAEIRKKRKAIRVAQRSLSASR